MSNTSNVLKALADGRYERGWFELDPQKPKQRVDARAPKDKVRVARDKFVRNSSSFNPGNALAHYVKEMQPDKKPSWFEKYGSYAPCLFAPGACAGLALLGALGGCTFDPSGQPMPDGGRTDAAQTDSAVDSSVDSSVDGATDGTTPVDADAAVPVGEPPKITWPKVEQLTNGIHMNNRIFWRLKLPQTTPAGKQIVGAEIDRSRNGSFVETIPVNLGRLHGSFDATEPFASHELAARVIYDDPMASTSDSTTLTVNADSSLAFRLGMNEGQGDQLLDSSVNTHNATMVGGATWVQDARGTGIALDGMGYATFGDASSNHLDFDWNQPFTIVADVNRGADNNWHAIYNRMDLDSSTARGVFFAFDDGNQLLLALNNDWSSAIRLRANTSMVTSITNVPSVVSVSYGGAGVVSSVMFTVNGDVQSTNPIYDDLAMSSTTIGVRSLVGACLLSGVPTYGLNGKIYYVAGFRRSLNPEEQRHENCPYLDSIDAVLPIYCD